MSSQRRSRREDPVKESDSPRSSRQVKRQKTGEGGNALGRRKTRSKGRTGEEVDDEIPNNSQDSGTSTPHNHIHHNDDADDVRDAGDGNGNDTGEVIEGDVNHKKRKLEDGTIVSLPVNGEESSENKITNIQIPSIKTEPNLGNNTARGSSGRSTPGTGADASGGSRTPRTPRLRNQGATDYARLAGISTHSTKRSVEEMSVEEQRRSAVKAKNGVHSLLKKRKAVALKEIEHLEQNGRYLDYHPFTTSFAQVTPPASSVVSDMIGFQISSKGAVQNYTPSASTSASTSSTSTRNTGLSRILRGELEKKVQTLDEMEKRRVLIQNKIKEFQSEKGRKLNPSLEPPRTKCHWDYLLEEMEWMAKDFTRERKWHKDQAKKLSRAVLNFHLKQKNKEARKERMEVLHRKRIAGEVAKIVNQFWFNIGSIVRIKFDEAMEKKKKEALDRHLEFLVNETERYTALLSQNLRSNATPAGGEAEADGQQDDDEGRNAKTERAKIEVIEEEEDSDDDIDPEFVPSEKDNELVDEEETLEQEEAEELKESKATRAKKRKEELDMLAKEAEIPIEDLVQMYQDLLDKEQEEVAKMGMDVEPNAEGEDEDGEEDQDESGDEMMDEEKYGTAALLRRDDELDENNKENRGASGEESRILAASSKAEAAQPKGNDFQSQSVKVKVPFLLRGGTLREYQHIGLEWMVSMYDNNINGILADEMGLGKTIQTISMLAYLACEKQIWGQHLVVVPTSVMINWEMEFKRWLPGFKILCYYGTSKERKQKRKGWNDPNTFHVCITSYDLILQDKVIFKRKKWKYLILDEAQHIKNFMSQRWQVLMSFKTERRLLLTGTPLQNNMMELWALMHFLMPDVFQSKKEFQQWFSVPVSEMAEGKQSVNQQLLSRLHGILRPFLLRRLKKDVAKQLPRKVEHVVHCRLSKRQRELYDDFISRSDTKETLEGGNFMGLMNVLMQLRKVCNHPDIFEGRAIVAPFDQVQPLRLWTASDVVYATYQRVLETVDLETMGLVISTGYDAPTYYWDSLTSLATPSDVILEARKASLEEEQEEVDVSDPFSVHSVHSAAAFRHWVSEHGAKIKTWRSGRCSYYAYTNELRTRRSPMYSSNLIAACTIEDPVQDVRVIQKQPSRILDFSNLLAEAIRLPEERAQDMSETLKRFVSIIPRARAQAPELLCSHPMPSQVVDIRLRTQRFLREATPLVDPYWLSWSHTQMYFPDKRLIQWDCGKLQTLALLLKQLKKKGSRVLIFTQMTKMLDILESFLNVYDYNYLRLDGSTKVQDRQRMMERFNNDERIFAFILSTRSGGVGVNLTGADTVVFYDSDWNPAIDQQAQDRCHRIGQTREVNIYRLVTKNTVEENILLKSNQKRLMNNMVIGDGEFTTQFLETLDPRELLGLRKIHVQNDEGGAAMETEDDDHQAAVSIPTLSGQPDGHQISRLDIELAMAKVEDAEDSIAAKETMKALRADLNVFNEERNLRLPQHPIEEQLTPVERLSLVFAETVDPVITLEERKAAEAALKMQEKRWYEEQMRKINEQKKKNLPLHDGSVFECRGAGAEVKEAEQDKNAAWKQKNECAEEEARHYWNLGKTNTEAYEEQIHIMKDMKFMIDSDTPYGPFSKKDFTFESDYIDQRHACVRDPHDWWGLFTKPQHIAKMMKMKDKSKKKNKYGRIADIYTVGSPGEKHFKVHIPKSRLKGITPEMLSSRRSAVPQLFRANQLSNKRSGERAIASNKSQSTSTSHKRRKVKSTKNTHLDYRTKIAWTEPEEKLLLKVLQDFGTDNWVLVHHIMSSTTEYSGRLRSVAECRTKYDNLRNGITAASLASSTIVEETKPTKKRKKNKKDDKSSSKSSKKEEKEKQVKVLPLFRDPIHAGLPQIYTYVELAMRDIKLSHTETQKNLTSSVPPTTDPSRTQSLAVHKSHKKAVSDSHIRLGLPANAVGKTLMPNQIIQLRQRSQHHSQSRAGMVPPGAKPKVPVSQQPPPHKGGVYGGYPQAGYRAPYPAPSSGSGLPQSNIPSAGNGYHPSSGTGYPPSNVAGRMPPKQSIESLMSVVKMIPELKTPVANILSRKDITEAQKAVQIESMYLEYRKHIVQKTKASAQSKAHSSSGGYPQ